MLRTTCAPGDAAVGFVAVENLVVYIHNQLALPSLCIFETPRVNNGVFQP